MPCLCEDRGIYNSFMRMSETLEMSKIGEAVFILNKCQKTVQRLYEAMEKHQEKGPMFSMFHFTYNLGYYMIMETASFLAEYGSHFNAGHVEPQYADRVKTVRKVLKPFFKRINGWKDLENFETMLLRMVGETRRMGKNWWHLSFNVTTCPTRVLSSSI